MLSSTQLSFAIWIMQAFLASVPKEVDEAALILVQQNDLQPLTVSMPRFLGLYIQDWQYLFTVALVAIVPVIILFSIIEKRLIGGLTAGSVR